jgi:FkbM family methyltransferase
MIKVKGDGRFGPMIYMDNDSYVGQAIEHYGENDYHAIDLLARLIQEDDVVVDVGAHIGTFTVPFARLVPKGYVVAFEAQPIIFNILCGNVAINNLFNVTTAQRAVSDSDGQPLYVPTLDYGKVDNFAGISLSEKRQDPLSPVAHTIKIDSLNLAKLKVLKIDVEGMELKVLQGAVETIKRTNPIIYVEAMPTLRPEIVRWMEGVGYKTRLHEFPLFNKDNHAKKAEDVLQNPGGPNVVVSPNLFCYPKNAEEALAPLFDNEFFTEKSGVTGPPDIPVPPTGCPYAGKQDLSVESSEITLELPKIYAKEE